MNAMAEPHNVRHTITINDQAFLKLRDNGRFGESYSDVILRILNQPKRDVKEKTDESIN
jgi:predicted CopG family antitoxin